LITGQVWFDKTNKVLQFQAEGAGAWASGGNMNTGREQTDGAGTKTATLAFGGGYPAKTVTEKYNGSSWTEVNDLNTGRRDASGFGTQTAAICAGGNDPYLAVVESFNGTSWTEVGDLNTGRTGLTGVGTTPAGLVYGGFTPPQTGVTESWNGSSGQKCRFKYS